MSRYVFSMHVGNTCVLYNQSTDEEDRMDAGLAEFGGSGYLSFWRRCKERANGIREIMRALRGVENAKEILPEVAHLCVPESEAKAVISDLSYGAEREV